MQDNLHFQIEDSALASTGLASGRAGQFKMAADLPDWNVCGFAVRMSGSLLRVYWVSKSLSLPDWWAFLINVL